MFIEFDNELSAQEAVSQLNGYRLDKAHTFKVNFLSDFEKYSQMDLVSELEKPVPYKNPGNLMWWQLKPECYDQFCLLYSDMLTSVYLNTPSQSTVLETRAVKLILFLNFYETKLSEKKLNFYF